MSDMMLQKRLIAIKKEMAMGYKTIGIYCGLSNSQANYTISKFVKQNYYLSGDIKRKIDEFLKIFGY